MHRVLMVVRREYLDRVRKKSFWVGIMIFPLIMGLMFVMPVLLGSISTDKKWTIAFVDATGQLLEPFRAGLAEQKLKDGSPKYIVEPQEIRGNIEDTEKALEPSITSGRLSAVLTIGDELDSEKSFRFYAKNVADLNNLRAIDHSLEKAVIALRTQRMHVSIEPAVLERLTAGIHIESLQVREGGKATQKGFVETYLGTFFFVLILFMSILLYGIAAMRGILEEKSKRIMEVLLASLTPGELMTGKILGIGLVGLTQMAVYMTTALAGQLYLMSGRIEGDWAWVGELLSPLRILYFILFFLLGYFMYTAMYAAIGAVCNSEQEAQNLQAPLQWSLMIPMMATIFFVQNPDSNAAVALSLIPPFSPMVMFMRICQTPVPAWQIALSIGLMIVGTILIFRGVAKVFRIGVLMYGKKPTIPEIMRWARS